MRRHHTICILPIVKIDIIAHLKGTATGNDGLGGMMFGESGKISVGLVVVTELIGWPGKQVAGSE
jgi:hypothetical protein